jgi:hypothetical protein
MSRSAQRFLQLSPIAKSAFLSFFDLLFPRFPAKFLFPQPSSRHLLFSSSFSLGRKHFAPVTSPSPTHTTEILRAPYHMPLSDYRLGLFVAAFPALSDMEDFEIWSVHEPAPPYPIHWEHDIPELPVRQYTAQILFCLAALFDRPLQHIAEIQLQERVQYADAIRQLARTDPPLFLALFAKLSADAELLDAC